MVKKADTTKEDINRAFRRHKTVTAISKSLGLSRGGLYKVIERLGGDIETRSTITWRVENEN